MYKSNYPFTESSSMLLNSGLRIGPGVVISANLYPLCGKVQYAQISFIGRKHITETIGHIQITDESGNFICDVEFDLKPTTYPAMGIAKRYGEVCGVVVVTRELIPILQSSYYPEPGSFIFSPSAFSPRPITSTLSGRLLSADGAPIDSVSFDSKYFVTAENTGVVSIKPKEHTTSDMKKTPVKCLIVNSVSANTTTSPKNICIMSKPGSGILFSSEDNNILVGGYRDL